MHTPLAALLPLLLLLALSLFPSPAMPYDANKWRRCAQSGFCTRHRARAEVTNEVAEGYHVDGASVRVAENSVQMTVTRSGGQVHAHTCAQLAVLLNVLGDSLRLRVQKPGGGEWFTPADDVVAPVQPSATVRVERQADALTLHIGRRRTVVHYAPFSVDVYDGDDLLVQLNGRRWLMIECGKSVVETLGAATPDADADDGTNSTITSRLHQGLGEESFDGHTDPKPHGPQSYGVDISFPTAWHLYGLPERTTPLILPSTRGADARYSEPYRLYNLDVFEYQLNSPDALYGAVPLMWAHGTKTVGVLWLSAAETWVDVDNTHTHWFSESGQMDLFILLGPTPDAVLHEYHRLTYAPSLPPQWSLGYHQCRWNYNDQQDVEQVHHGFEKHQLPVDVLWLDIEHTQGKRYFTFHPEKFAHPQKMISDFAAKGRKMVTIIDPHLKEDAQFPVYQQAKDQNLLVKHASGEDFLGHCWPGQSGWLDYFLPQARAYWHSLFKYTSYVGSTEALFTWNDMNEPSVFSGPETTMPKNLLHAGKWEHRDVHQMYGMMMHRSTYEGQLLRSVSSATAVETRKSLLDGPQPHRPFVLSRAFFTGTHRYGPIWTGDNAAQWDHFQHTHQELLSLSLGGLPFTGADIGGFFGNPSPTLLVRWYQHGIHYGFVRAHAHIETKRREPWLFGEPFLSLTRQALQWRYRVLQYWYTCFRHSAVSGRAVLRPVWMSFSGQEAARQERGYLIGEAMYVWPLLEELVDERDVKETTVELPPGEWFDLRSFERRVGKFAMQHSLDTPVPVYLRGGHVVPMKDRPRRSSLLMANDPVSFVVALQNGRAEGDVYLDDGESFNYVLGGFVHRRLVVEQHPQKLVFRLQKWTYEKMQPWQRPPMPERTEWQSHDFSGLEARMTYDEDQTYVQQLQVAVDKITVLGEFTGLCPGKQQATLIVGGVKQATTIRCVRGGVIVKLPNQRLAETWEITLQW